MTEALVLQSIYEMFLGKILSPKVLNPDVCIRSERDRKWLKDTVSKKFLNKIK